jgi:hypothetical protein
MRYAAIFGKRIRSKIIFLSLGLSIGALGVFAVLHLRDELKGGTAPKILSPAPGKPAEPPPIKQIEPPGSLQPRRPVATAKGAKSAGRDESAKYKWVSEKTEHGWVSRKELVTKDTGRSLSQGSGTHPSGEDQQLTGLRFLRKGRNTGLNFERARLNDLRRRMMVREDQDGRASLMDQIEESERQINSLVEEIQHIDAEIEKRERLH